MLYPPTTISIIRDETDNGRTVCDAKDFCTSPILADSSAWIVRLVLHHHGPTKLQSLVCLKHPEAYSHPKESG